jgi:D-sedoheptulose 7-phosphate isomerase
MDKVKDKLVIQSFNDSADIKNQIISSGEYKKIIFMANKISSSIENGGKLLICGNGGSAADAQHLAAELLVRLKPLNNREGIPAIALAMDSSTMTACGNDFGYEVMYERMVETLGLPGDILLGITTSGNSKNVNLALEAAKKNKITSFALLGSSGGKSKDLCDEYFLVPSSVTARIQESHITAGHAIMELVENNLLDSGHISIKK